MEKVQTEASIRASEAIQRNMSEDATRTAAELERQEAVAGAMAPHFPFSHSFPHTKLKSSSVGGAAERAAELAAAEAQFDKFREQLIRKIIARMQNNAVRDLFDR